MILINDSKRFDFLRIWAFILGNQYEILQGIPFPISNSLVVIVLERVQLKSTAAQSSARSKVTTVGESECKILCGTHFSIVESIQKSLLYSFKFNFVSPSNILPTIKKFSATN